MRFILLFLLFSSSVYAQRHLSPEYFRTNVRPNLNGILGDFYQLVTVFPDFPKGLIPVIKELDTLSSDKEILIENCPRILNDRCIAQINSLRQKLQEIKALSLELLGRTHLSSSLYLNSITGMKLIYRFDARLEEIKGEFDNASFLISAKISEKRESYLMIKKLDELDTILSLVLVEFIPYLYRTDFKHFYFNFVHPVQQQISKNINSEFLYRNVVSLNFAVNLLHLNLTKRNKKTPEGAASYLQTIHNRWNSILRQYY